MSRHPVDLSSLADRPHRGVSRVRRSVSRYALLLVLFSGILLLSQVLSNWSLLAQPVAYAADVQTAHSTPGNFSFQQYLKQGPQHSPVKSGPPSPYPQPPKQTPNAGTKPTTPPPSIEPATMKPITQPLSSTFLAGGTGVSAFDLKGSDGRLEVQVQPGSLDLTHATISGGKAPSGALTLQVTQNSGHFEAVLNQLGDYQVQVVDSQGQVVNGIALRTPLAILYHYQMSEMLGLNLDPAHILLTWPTPLKAAQQAKQPTAPFVIAMRNDPVAHTLTAQSRVFGPGPFIMHNDGQNQMAPSPHLASVQGNNGQLSYSYPLQVIPGSGGVAPQLALDYSSMDPNDRHSPTSPANDEGDGFSLSMGSITSQVYANSGVTWYFLNGIDNVSDRLIEYDMTNKLFYTEHLSYLRIQQVTVGGQPCFNVWDKSGTFYEVGCTGDSLEYSMPGGVRENYQWNVDRIIAPSEGPQGTGSAGWRLIKVSYMQDCGSTDSPGQNCVANHDAIRDAVIQQITYGYNSSFGSLNSFDGVAGTIDFTYLAPFSTSSGGWATAYTYGPTGNDPCTTPPITPTLRCDDPIQKVGGFTPPDVLGTFSLASVTSYLNTDGSANNAAYGYRFTYQDTPFQSCTDPISGLSGYCAGEHVLTQITPIVYQGGTAHTLRATTFSYSPAPGASGALTDTYFDSLANNGTTTLTAATTWQYLTSYQDLNTGIGEAMTYSLAYSNTDGTPTIENGQQQITDDRFDALYCSSNATNPNPSLRCFQGNFLHPDDHAWSTEVVTSVTSSGKDSSALGAATTTYTYYRLAPTGAYSGSGAWCHPDQLSPVVEQECVGDNWIASGDKSDWQDYYHAEYRGFAEVFQVSPAGDLTNSYYFSTEGWYQPANDPADYDGGQVQVQEVYQGSSFDPTKLLSKTLNIYPGPYPQNGDSPQNTTNNPTACYMPGGGSTPYAACDVMPLSSKTTEYDETNSSNAPWVEHDYTYDDYDPSTGFTSGSHYHNLTKEVISGSNLPGSVYPLTEQWSYATNDSGAGGTGWIYYNVNHVSHSEIDDHSGHIWQCQDTSYDQGNSNPTPTAGLPTTVSTYTSGNCGTQTNPLTTTYQMYDAYGNTVATVDANGAATPPLYNSMGCTTSSTIEIANSAWNKGKYTGCSTYDSGHYYALPTGTTNALSQSTSFSYDATQGNTLTSTTDPNSQATSDSYSYDSSGNSMVKITLPPDTTHFTNQTSSYSTCTGSSALPCYEVDKLSYQYNSNAALSSTFYDSLGRAVETSTPFPAPSGAPPNTNYYTIVSTEYNDGNHSIYQSEPFVVAVSSSTHGSGYIEPNLAKDYLNNTIYGTATYYDALGRVLAVRDPLFNATQATGIPCSTAPQFAGQKFTACTNYTIGQVSGDSNYYISATSVDPNDHASVGYLDALGRTVYTQQDSNFYGGIPAATPNEQTTTVYNALDKPTSVTVTDLAPQTTQTITTATTTMQYDDLGRLTQLVDPDRGTHNYTYDPNGNVIQDSSGTRTIGYAYDLLNRPGCVQDEPSQYSTSGACGTSANGGSYNPYIQNTYDTNQLTLSGTTDEPIGQLTRSVSTTYFSGSAASVTEAYEHDGRGRSIGEQVQFSLPSAWNVTTALPAYQMQSSYNDADQLTTTTTSTVPTGQGFTTTQVYDATTGVKSGLSNNGTATANLATLSYTSQAQLSSLNLLSSTGGALAIDSLGYDGNLRLASMAASWQGGSGNSGTIFSQNLTYDPASNLISLSSTQNAAGSGTGGSETSNFCYDEQNRLVWAGNSGTQPAAGKGTCGSATLAHGLSGANYNDSYVYTHLGQLWQAPRNGGGTQYQYLYCNTQPHQLSGLYAIGSTCSSKSGQGYLSSYDAFGNVTSRTFSGTTSTLTYDILDHLTQWYASSTNQEQYLYDSSGQRLLRRFTNGSGTTILTYPFGIEEHQYSGSGTNQSNVYYYFLAGHLLGSLDSNGTEFYLTDAQGSLVSSFTNAAGGATMKSNQLFGPYGNTRYNAGSLNTAKGFIGQYNDGTGLDYFHARYYDPIVGVFLSADTVQGNVQGVNPYEYVGGNPETHTDPSGRYMGTSIPLSQQGGAIGYIVPGGTITTIINNGAGGVTTVDGQFTPHYNSNLDMNTFTQKQEAEHGSYNPNVSSSNTLGGMLQQVPDGISAFLSNFWANFTTPTGDVIPCGLLSFTPTTKIATSQGEKAIGSLHPGERVWAYNTKTHKMEFEPIVHVWINHDNDLVDVTIAFTPHTKHGKPTQKISEVVHTNKKHPFLTVEKGFVTVSQLHIGMHVVSANGSVGTITTLKIVPGTMKMYNLEVAQDHTYTVGDGKWIVHNCGGVDDSTFDNSFRGLEGSSYEQIMARIPTNAREMDWKPDPNGALFGQQWTWRDGSYRYTLRMHGPDMNAVRNYPDSNAANGWVFRLYRSGNGEGGYYMDSYGKWHPEQETDWQNVPGGGRMVSPKGVYDSDVANDTHIPMEDPIDTYFDAFIAP